jgi:hypothetical protein
LKNKTKTAVGVAATGAQTTKTTAQPAKQQQASRKGKERQAGRDRAGRAT